MGSERLGETVYDTANHEWGVITDAMWYEDVKRWEYTYQALWTHRFLSGWIRGSRLVLVGVFPVSDEREV